MLWRQVSAWMLLVVFCAAPVWARPAHKRSLKQHYGELLSQRLHSCTTCHFSREQAPNPAEFDEEAPPHNPFGVRLRELGEELEVQKQPAELITRLQQIAAEDADGDGVANELEILAGHAPGDAKDKPSADELAAAIDKQKAFQSRQKGYVWQQFRPVVRPPVPAVQQTTWVRNPIDAFIAAEHEARGLTHRPEAPRGVLLRRVYLDLIGLPPTRAELHAFLTDASPDAYEKVVDRLLASPQYGERWGRHWMDVWRYSDWAGWGQQVRDSQPHIWHWRDWIIESLNADRGYDQMVREMLAADELYPTDANALRATGYLVRNFKLLSRETWMQDTVNHTAQAFLGLTVGCARCHDHMYDAVTQQEYYKLRAVFEPHQVRLDRVPDVADTAKDALPRVFDAQLDAVTYLFKRGDERTPDKEHPLKPGVPRLLTGVSFEVQSVKLPAEAYYPSLAAHVQQQMVTAAEKQVADAKTALVDADKRKAEAKTEMAAKEADAVLLAEKVLRTAETNLASFQARIAADRAKYAEPPAANAAELAASAGEAERKANLTKAEEELLRAEQQLTAAKAAKEANQDKANEEKLTKAVADAEKKQETAKKQFDTATAALSKPTTTYTALGTVHPTTSTGRRAALARWLTNRNNPLAARVAVNHIWLRHFGHALVPSMFDFGQNGQPPTHPALLDWLAAELMEPSVTSAQPWSMKHLHRLIVTINTYKQGSEEKNPEIATASNPKSQIPNPQSSNLQPLDPENRFLWRMNSRRAEAEVVRDSILHIAGQLDTKMGGSDIDCNQGLTVKRRSVYFRHAQEKQMEFLKLFDVAAVSECYERKESIVPQQALALANSELTLVQSRILARSLSDEFSTTDEPFIIAAFEQLLSRQPSTDELAFCRQFLTGQTQWYAENQARVSATGGPATDGSKPSAIPSQRARENLVHVLMNHHEFVTIR